MTGRAAELRRAGVDVVNLSVGEPDFPTPAAVQTAGIRAIVNNQTRYTAAEGLLELRKAVCTKLERDNNLHYTPDEILISNGGKYALYNLCQVLFQEGDEVILFTPYWVSYPDLVRVTGAEPVFVETDPNSQFEPVMEDLEHKITPRTKGIIINSPTNPTGGVWSKKALQQVLELVVPRDIRVISDECYEQFVYDAPFVSTALLTDSPEKVITVQSCSKTYAMTGWRIGYTAADAEVIAAMKKLQGHGASSPNAVGQYAAIEALTGDQSYIPGWRQIFKGRRDLIVERVNAVEGLHCPTPAGAFYVYPDFSAFLGKTAQGKKLNTAGDLALYLLESEGLATVPGESFGSGTHIRFSYTAAEADLIRGMDRLAGGLAKLN